jgi:hypothetical protein
VPYRELLPGRRAELDKLPLEKQLREIRLENRRLAVIVVVCFVGMLAAVGVSVFVSWSANQKIVSQRKDSCAKLDHQNGVLRVVLHRFDPPPYSPLVTEAIRAFTPPTCPEFGVVDPNPPSTEPLKVRAG